MTTPTITPPKYIVIADDDGLQRTFYFYDEESLEKHFEGMGVVKRGHMKCSNVKLNGLPAYEGYNVPVYVESPCVVYQIKK